MESVLVLFDLDDTLLITDAKIILRDPASNEVAHRLSTDEYRDWKKSGKTQQYAPDFSEFSDIDEVTNSFLRAKPGPGLDILRDALDDPDAEIGILTARSSEKSVAAALPKFLAKQGVDVNISPDLIFAVNDPKYNFQGKTDSERKLHIILRIIDERIFDSVFLIDDDPMHKEVIDDHCKTHHIKNIHVYSVV